MGTLPESKNIYIFSAHMSLPHLCSFKNPETSTIDLSPTDHCPTHGQPVIHHWKDYQPPTWTVTHTEVLCDIAFDIFHAEGEAPVPAFRSLQLDACLHYRKEVLPQTTSAATRITTILNITSNHPQQNHPLILNGNQIPILEFLEVDGRRLTSEEYTFRGDDLVLAISGRTAEVKMSTILFPSINSECEGLYQSDKILVTQMEALGFRRFTYFPDRPDILSTYRVTVSAPKAEYPVLLSNGNIEHTSDLADGRHSVTFFDPWPKPSYLFALVAGSLACIEDSFITASNKTVSLRLYGIESQVPRLKYGLECLKKCMRWDEEYFGFEYDLDIFSIVAVSNFNAGAMENKGLNIFNDRLLVGDIRSASDDRLKMIDRVIAHEYFHNRTGNRVTCRSWFELTLKEGLTVLRDTLYAEKCGSPEITRIETVQDLRQTQFAEDLGANKHPIRMESMVAIDNFYTATVYEKGAEVIRMALELIGEELFVKGVKHYCQKYDCQAVTCEDFWCALHEVSGYDFTQFFRWYYQAGLPKIRITDSFEPQSGVYTITIQQDLTGISSERGDNEPFEIPIRIASFNSDGTEIILGIQKGHEENIRQNSDGSITLIARALQETFSFSGLTVKPHALSLLRNYSSPVILDFAYNEQILLTLFRYDTDSFNRFDAAQRLMAMAVGDLHAGKRATVSPDFLNAFSEILASAAVEQDLKALFITPPSLKELGLLHHPLDYVQLDTSRSTFLGSLATSLNGPLLDLLEKTMADDPIESTVGRDAHRAFQARALRKACLELLWHYNPDFVYGIAITMVRNAQTMADELTGLELLNRDQNSYQAEGNEIFITRWHRYDDIAPDWFSGQVAHTRTNAAQLVETLAKSSYFCPTNPNYIRALYGGFSRNLCAFHAHNGSGYNLVADAIISVADQNGLLGARLAKLFDDYPRLAPHLQTLMRSAATKVYEHTLAHTHLDALNEAIGKIAHPV